MAWTVTNKEMCAAADPQVTIICDSTSDVSDLPTDGFAPGSIAVVADEGAPAYMLNASGTWSALQS